MPSLVGTAHEKPSLVDTPCRRLCPPYKSRDASGEGHDPIHRTVARLPYRPRWILCNVSATQHALSTTRTQPREDIDESHHPRPAADRDDERRRGARDPHRD